MDAATLPLPRWTPFGAPKPIAEALVIQVIEPGSIAGANMLAERWSDLFPRSAFAGIELDLGARRIALAPIQEAVWRAAKRLEVAFPQIVMVGVDRAALRILDVALCGGLADVNAVLIDLPSAGIVVGHPPPRGAFRFVQHRPPDDPDGRLFDGTMQTLRAASLDIRTMVIPDDAATTDRAVDTFLVELVTRASRSPSVRGRGPGAPAFPERCA